MNRYYLGIAGLAVLALLTGAAPAWTADREAPVLSAEDRDALALAAKIDGYIAAEWKARGVTPAEQTDDAEFCRRIYLDLAGRIPTILEARDFIGNPAPDKRWQKVQELLRSDRYPKHWAAVWRSIMFAQTNSQQAAAFMFMFQNWLEMRLKENVGYDKLVRELMTAEPNTGAGPGVFYQVNEQKLENIAAATSRLFLGVKIECAQCHNHPFAKWSRAQFWEYAAFFTDMPRQEGRGGNLIKSEGPHQLTIPGTDKSVQAKFLDGKKPKFQEDIDGRQVLVEWMTQPNNPWFARAAVNRMWEYFFGLGLVEPVDDFTADHVPSHPELLDELARQFTAHNYDLQFLIKAITATKAYQLTSTLSHESQGEQRLIGRMPVRGMSPEQLFDSLAEATRLKENGVNDQGFVRRGGGPQGPRGEFLIRFPNQDRRIETQTSILQALYFMNGKLTTDASSLAENENLRNIAEANESTARRVRELYLITLSRLPRPDETERFVKYIESGGPTKDPKKALTDVFWALLNSTEFYFNH